MDVFLVIVTIVLSFLVSLFGFSQIIGSAQHASVRPIGATIFTIVLWLVILLVVAILVHLYFSKFAVSYYIGTGAGLLATLFSGRIE